MLEAILAKKGSVPKEGLTKGDSASSKEGESGSFKDLFVKLVAQKETKGKAALEEKPAPQVAIKEQGKEAKTITSMLESILQASGREKSQIKDLDAKAKMMQAKSVLEKSLGQKVDLAQLKDAKSLGDLIKQANKKGLNAKIISFEQTSSQKAAKTDQKPDAQKAQKSVQSALQNQSQTVKQDGIKQALVQQAKAFDKPAQANNAQNNNLSSVLAQKLHDKGEQNPGKQDFSQIVHKDGEAKEGKQSSAQNAALMQALQKDKKDSGKESKKDTLDKLLQTRFDDDKLRQKKTMNDTIASKLDLSKNIEKTAQKADRGTDVMQSLQEIAAKEQPTSSNSSQNASQSNATVNTQQGAQSEFSLKSNEAKQAVKQFASSLKEQVDNYKPPVSKLTLSLNPKSLGEVDVVIKTRGDQLSVQLSSNTAPALQLLAQNSQDLRQNLLNMGFENVSMQFSSGSQQEGREQNQQQQAAMMREFEDFDEELSAEVEQLEIVLPRYV
ncbi:MAG: flagellar hook-length control protein FliK [Campylobacterota bacterium]